MLKLAILGLGNIASKFVEHVKTLEETGEVKIVAVASRNIEKATAFAEKFGIEKAYGSYDELYQDNEIEAVYIATLNTFHKEQTIACIDANKAVLCEKPFFTSLLIHKKQLTMQKKKMFL